MIGQAVHIFKKDVRKLRLEIAAVLALTLGFAVAGVATGQASDLATMLQTLLPIAWWFVIARAIHAEAIPGDRQFWLTRPYDRKSLWAAKALFAVVFINLPILIAQAAMLAVSGLPLAANVAKLLWEEALLAAVLIMPAAALAAVTINMAQFILAALPLAAVIGIAFGYQDLGTVAWIPNSSAVLWTTLLACTILFLQFLRRKTVLSRVLALSGIALGLVAYWLVPFDRAFAIQSWLAPFRGSFAISLDRSTPPIVQQPVQSAGRVKIDLRWQVAGLDLDRMKWDKVSFTIETPSDASDVSEVIWPEIPHLPQGFITALFVERALFDKVKDQPVRIHGVMFLTELGEERSTNLTVGGAPVDVPGAGHCFTKPISRGPQSELVCQSALGWPERLVQVRISPTVAQAMGNIDSYSPFPDALALNPVLSSSILLSEPDLRSVEILTRDMVSHLRYEFEVPDVHLADFVPH